MPRTLVLALALSGCLSADTAQQRWDDWVDDHDSCETADDCAVVFPGCPLGCFDAVSAEFEDEARAEADRLIGRYEAAGRSCAYDCIETPALVCDAGSCGFAE